MSTKTNTPHSEPRGTRSGAIATGADQLVALFEAEKTRLKTASFQQIKEVETDFAVYRRSSEQRIASFEAATRNANIALARSLADGSLAREQMLDVQQQIARIQIEFDQLNASLKEAGFSWDSQFHKLERVGSENTMDGSPQMVVQGQGQTDVLHGGLAIEELQNQLAESQRILEDQKRMCTSIEKERDDLKATLGAEVTMLKDLVFSLQYEVEWQKRHSVPSDGKEEGTIGSVSSMENGYHSGEQINLSYPTHLEHHSFCGLENISPPRFTVQSAAVKLDLPLRTLSTTLTTAASNASSSRMSNMSTSSTAARKSPSGGLFSGTTKFQRTQQSVSVTSIPVINHLTKDTSRPLSAPVEPLSPNATHHWTYQPNVSLKGLRYISTRPAPAHTHTFD